MDRKALAHETVRVVHAGSYVAPSGTVRSIEALVRDAVDRSALFTDDDEPRLREALARASRADRAARVEVTREGSTACMRRLVEREGASRVAVLNFASGRNPGGGFLTGAIAQEEDLACASALYACLAHRPYYYARNRASGSPLYADELIYSPQVPFFRGEDLALLEEPFTVSVLTSPAPNAGVARSRDPSCGAEIERALTRRAWQVLAVAAAHAHRVLVLGAWGCGVFRNDPVRVADVFGRWLAHEDFHGVFDRVVFAVLSRKPNANLAAFEARFGRAVA